MHVILFHRLYCPGTLVKTLHFSARLSVISLDFSCAATAAESCVVQYPAFRFFAIAHSLHTGLTSLRQLPLLSICCGSSISYKPRV